MEQSKQSEEKQSEEKQTITKTPPPHIKNPKRVAQGKKLAAISRAAKQKKKDQMEAIPKDEDEERSTTSLISSTGTILGTCCTLLLTYIAYSQLSTKPTEVPEIPKDSPVVYKDLSQYDL